MKLFYFNPNNYGEEYFVMAEGKEEALACLLLYLIDKVHDPKQKHFKDLNMEEHDKWKGVDALNPETFPDEYTLDEYNARQIIRSELA